MDWQIGFLGYRPSIGELLVAVILAMLAERAWRLFSRTWDFAIDLIAASVNRLRSRRIKKLERKIEQIKRYEANDRQVLLLFIKRLTGLVGLFGTLGVVSIVAVRSEIVRYLHGIMAFLNVPLPSGPGTSVTEQVIFPEAIEPLIRPT